MKENNRLIRHIGSKYYSLCIDSNRITDDLVFLKSNNIKSVTLIEKKGGYTIDNIDFLRTIPNLKEIYMADCPCITNYNGLTYVNELSVLIFSPKPKLKIDLSHLSLLEFLSFQYSHNIIGLEKLFNLSKLWVWGGNHNFFSHDVFSSYKKLATLEINCSKLQDLRFVKDCPLETLVFNRINTKFSLIGLNELVKTLRVLKFIATKQVIDISQLSSLRHLSSLILSNSFALDNCRIIENLRDLKSLTLIGTSFFIDGDLSSIRYIIDNLQHNNIANRKHYFLNRLTR